MPTFVSQLIEKMVNALFPHGVREAEGERIRDVIFQSLSREYLERYDWDIPSIIEKVVDEELENLPPDVQSALVDSVLESADDRIAEVIRDEVRLMLRELTPAITA